MTKTDNFRDFFLNFLNKIAMKALGLDNKSNDAYKIIEDMDKNNDGLISFDEFLDLLSTQITDKDHEKEIRKIHQFISNDKTNKINL